MRTLLALSLSGLILSGVVVAWAGDTDPFGGGAEPANPGPADPFGVGAELESPSSDDEPPLGPNQVRVPYSGKVYSKPAELPVVELGPLPNAVDDLQPDEWERHLRRKAKLVAAGHSLEQLSAAVSEQTGLRMQIRTRPLDEIGIANNVPIEMTIDGATLGGTLHVLLRQIGPDLDYYVEDGVLYVTTMEEMEEVELERLQQRMFDLSDLHAPPIRTTVRHVWGDDARLGDGVPCTDIQNVIKSIIVPDQWSDVGGPYTIQCSRGLLIVNAPRQTNQQIADLLSQLRRAKAWDGRDLSVLDDFARPAAAVWKPFEIPVTLDYQERPLSEVVGDISTRYKVPVQLDYESLREIGIDGDVLVTIDIENTTLRDAISSMLRQIDPDLGVYISRGVMMVVVLEGCPDVSPQIYPVCDLATNERELEDLAKLLREAVAPEVWDEVGGMGSVQLFSPASVLVVSQTEDVLERVDAFLAELRNQLARRTADHPPTPADEKDSHDTADKQWPIVAYHVYLPIGFNKPDETKFGTLAVLPPLVRRLTGENNWQDEPATIEMLGTLLVVQQTPAMQRRIERLLRDLGVLLARNSGMCVSITPVVGDKQAGPQSPQADPFGGPDPPAETSDTTDIAQPRIPANNLPIVGLLTIDLKPLPKGIQQPASLEQHLQRQVTMTVGNRTLIEVLTVIGENTDRQVIFDQAAFDEIGIKPESTTSLTIKHGMSLKNALRLLLRNADPDLAFLVEENALILTTREVVEERWRTVFIDVKDFLPPKAPQVEDAGGAGVQHVYRNDRRDVVSNWGEELANAMHRSTGPWTSCFDDVLILHGEASAIAQVERILTDIRRAGHWDGSGRNLREDFRLSEEIAWQRLDKVKADVQFEEQTLDEVLETLSKDYQLEFQLDVPALAEIGLRPDTPVTLTVKNATLRQVLTQMLRHVDPDLTVVAYDDYYLVSTRDVDEDRLLTKVLPVADLVREEYALTDLSEAIQSMVEPDTWDVSAGPGPIAEFPRANALLVSQTPQVLIAIDDFLATLRRIIAAREGTNEPANDMAAADAEQPVPDKLHREWHIAVYHVAALDASTIKDEALQLRARAENLKTLASMIRRTTADEWSDERATIDMLGGNLVIRQQPAVHARIEKLLNELNVLGYPFAVGGGGFQPPQLREGGFTF